MICATSSSCQASARSSGCAPSTRAASSTLKSCPASAATRASLSASRESLCRRRSINWPTLLGAGRSATPPRSAVASCVKAADNVSRMNSGLPPVWRASGSAHACASKSGNASETSSASIACTSSGPSSIRATSLDSVRSSQSRSRRGISAVRTPTSQRISASLPAINASSDSTLASSAKCRSSIAHPVKPALLAMSNACTTARCRRTGCSLLSGAAPSSGSNRLSSAFAQSSRMGVCRCVIRTQQPCQQRERHALVAWTCTDDNRAILVRDKVAQQPRFANARLTAYERQTVPAATRFPAHSTRYRDRPASAAVVRRPASQTIAGEDKTPLDSISAASSSVSLPGVVPSSRFSSSRQRSKAASAAARSPRR